jgi:hypothetical protein
MNPPGPSAATPVAPSVPPRPLRGLYASLERLINTASFVSVDLTDTVFVSLHEERDRARRYINYLE